VFRWCYSRETTFLSANRAALHRPTASSIRGASLFAIRAGISGTRLSRPRYSKTIVRKRAGILFAPSAPIWSPPFPNRRSGARPTNVFRGNDDGKMSTPTRPSIVPLVARSVRTNDTPHISVGSSSACSFTVVHTDGVSVFVPRDEKTKRFTSENE